jgi:hypothetical protein
MRNNRTPVIRISSVKDTPGKFLASFHSEFLDATYSLLFNENVTGAVALHRFAQMIGSQYGCTVELQIADDLFPVSNQAVEDILATIGINGSRKAQTVG